MEQLVKMLNETQKTELINTLWKVDDILEQASAEIGDDSDYHNTRFYDGLYDLMYVLGQWC